MTFPQQRDDGGWAAGLIILFIVLAYLAIKVLCK